MQQNFDLRLMMSADYCKTVCSVKQQWVDSIRQSVSNKHFDWRYLRVLIKSVTALGLLTYQFASQVFLITY